MDSAQLRNYINLGKAPISIFAGRAYENIDRILRFTKGNTVFLDFEDEWDDEGGLRVTFTYDSFEDMVSAAEKYIGSDISDWKIVWENPSKKAAQISEWQKLQEDVYSHRIAFPENYSSFFIGSLYWNGLYLNEISPESSDEELKELIIRSMKKYE